MDFYASQESARRTTRWLVVAFFVCVVLVVAAVDAVIVILLGASERNVSPAGPIAASTIIVLCIVCGSSLFKIWSLRRGGAVVARNLGATRVRRETSDFALKRLLNVVEEMSIASGVTMPEVYVLEDEDGINAFAAGHSPADAAVVVTRGAVARLKREELQGVIAHEFSHVLNGDSRLYLRLLGLTFGLLAIAIVARFVLQSGARGKSDRKGGGAAIVLAALAVMALGYIGVFFGRLLQAAVSRHRERLADASAVQFTRNPLGLKGALLKVAGVDSGSTLANPGAEQVAHMLFAPGMQRLMRTHPTIEERLEAIVPGFRRAELPALAAAAARDAERMIAADVEANTANFSPASAPATAGAGRIPAMAAGLQAAGLPSAVPAAAQAFVGQVGSLQDEHVRYAEQARLAIPEPLREFADSPAHARALILSVVMSRQPAVEAKQREIVERAFGAGVLETVTGMRPLSDSLEPQLRLPTLQQIFPALRDLSRAERQQLHDVVEQLSQADARIDVFECCLALLLAANLDDEMNHGAPHGSASLLQETGAVQALLSILAAQGADGPAQATAAYNAGIALVFPEAPPPYLVSDAWPKALAGALSNLAALRPFAKKILIDGLARCVSHDGKLTIDESELLRTTCAVLHCPLPPIVAPADGGS